MVNRYLKYGTSKEFDYGEPVPIIDMKWEDAKEQFKRNLSRSIDKFPTDGVAFCGTMSACSLLQLKKMSTWSVDIGIDTKAASKIYGCENHTTKIENLEESIIEINKINKFLRSSLEDIYAYTRQKFWSQHSKTGLCEGGTDYLLASNSSLMNLAIRKKEYKVSKAIKLISPDRLNVFKGPDFHFDTYEDCFNHSVSIFTNDELMDLGLEPVSIKLRENSLEHYTKAMFDWGYQTVYEQRTSVFADHFGFQTFSPYINDPDMVNFCLSLPMEMKYCLGRGKHILKETLPVDNLYITNRIFPKIYQTIESELEVLMNKYLNIIYDYFSYEKIQKHLNDFIKKWMLLNLAIWMENNNGKILL